MRFVPKRVGYSSSRRVLQNTSQVDRRSKFGGRGQLAFYFISEKYPDHPDNPDLPDLPDLPDHPDLPNVLNPLGSKSV